MSGFPATHDPQSVIGAVRARRSYAKAARDLKLSRPRVYQIITAHAPDLVVELREEEDKLALDALRMSREHPTAREAARALGVPYTTFLNRVTRGAKIAAAPSTLVKGAAV